MRIPRRARSSALVFALTLALVPGCQATGKTANAYFEWGGRIFTTNPVSVAPYFLGFGLFFVAGLPLDLFSWLMTLGGWHEGSGEDWRASALAPSIFLGTTGGVILGAPFFPFGLPWWDPERDDEPQAPLKAPEKPAAGAPSSEVPTARAKPREDDGPTAGAPGR